MEKMEEEEEEKEEEEVFDGMRSGRTGTEAAQRKYTWKYNGCCPKCLGIWS